VPENINHTLFHNKKSGFQVVYGTVMSWKSQQDFDYTINEGVSPLVEAVLERRTSERLLSVTKVTIAYSNLGLVPGKLVDISLGGMCVDTGSVSLPVNAPVTVSFVIENASGVTDCEAHAIIVRNHASSCCVMFDGMDTQTHQALRSLVGDWQLLPDSSGSSQIAAL